MTHDAPRGADPIRDARAARARDDGRRSVIRSPICWRFYGRQANVAEKLGTTDVEPQIRRVFRAYLDTPLAALTVGGLQR